MTYEEQELDKTTRRFMKQAYWGLTDRQSALSYPSVSHYKASSYQRHGSKVRAQVNFKSWVESRATTETDLNYGKYSIWIEIVLVVNNRALYCDSLNHGD